VCVCVCVWLYFAFLFALCSDFDFSSYLYFFLLNFFFFNYFFSLLFFQSAQSKDLGVAHEQMKAEGKTELKLEACEYTCSKKYLDEDGKYLVLDKPTKIIGQGRGLTTLVGFGLKIQGKKSDGIVEIENLKIKGAGGIGLFAEQGMKVIMRGCTVEDCEYCGVYAWEADISCEDLQVVGCGGSGVYAYNNATITLSGQGTTIQGNGTKGRSGDYGLDAFSSSSTIHLVHPLTKEQISTHNGGGGNWGGYGGRNIKQISK